MGNKIMEVLTLLDSIDYDDYKDEIDTKCKKLIKEFIQERKELKGYDKKQKRKTTENEYKVLKDLLEDKSITRNLKSCKSFEDYYNS